MSLLKVAYKGSNIIDTSISTTKTIKTSGKYCEDDLSVTVDSAQTVEEKDINFYDYDGTLVESWTLAELQTKTELPPNPSHEGLVAQGWNWTLAELKADNGMTDVGQLYITDDGKTRLYFNFIKYSSFDIYEVELNFRQSEANGVTIDWGDGSATETDSSVGYVIKTHTYQSTGEFILTLLPTDTCVILLGRYQSNSYYSILTKGNDYLTKLECGNGIDTNAYSYIKNCTNLETISFCTDFPIFGKNTLNYNTKLKCIIGSSIPTTYSSDMNCNANVGLEVISLPHNTSYIGYRFFYNGTGQLLTRLNLRMVNTLSTYSLVSCTNIRFLDLSSITSNLHLVSGYTYLRKIILGANITSTSNNFLNSCTSLKEILFKGSTPFTIGSASSFTNLPTDCVLYIPYDSTAYLTATNYPDPTTYTYYGYGTFTSGTTLPTAPTDTTYTLTWYASIEDAVAQTNPITTGNGSEVYCRYTEVTE